MTSLHTSKFPNISTAKLGSLGPTPMLSTTMADHAESLQVLLLALQAWIVEELVINQV